MKRHCPDANLLLVGTSPEPVHPLEIREDLIEEVRLAIGAVAFVAVPLQADQEKTRTLLVNDLFPKHADY